MLETSIFWCKMYINCGFDSSLFKHGVNFLLASLENMSLVGHNVANTLDTMSRMTIMFVLFIPKGFLLNISIKSPSVNFPCCIMPFWRHIRHIYIILYIYIPSRFYLLYCEHFVEYNIPICHSSLMKHSRNTVCFCTFESQRFANHNWWWLYYILSRETIVNPHKPKTSSGSTHQICRKVKIIHTSKGISTYSNLIWFQGVNILFVYTK